MLKIKYIIVLVLSLLFSSPVFAQSEKEERATEVIRSVESLVQRSFEVDPILKELDGKISAENSRIGERFSYPPLQISYGFFILPIQTRTGPQRQKISVKQSIPWPGIASAMNDLPGTKAATFFPKKSLRKRQIRYEVEQLAWTYWHHRRQLELTKAHIILLDGLISSTRSLNIIGRAPKSAVSLATYEKGKISDRLEDEKNNLAVAKVALQKWSGEFRKLELEAKLRGGEDPGMNENHPELAALDRADALDRAKIKVEEKKDYPAFTMGLDYFEIGKRDNGEGGQDALMAMVGIALPLWSRPSNAESEALHGTIVARNFRREEVKRAIVSKSKIETLNRENFRRRILYLEKTIIPLAEIYRADLTAEYETGNAKIQDVIQALDRVYRLQLELADTLAKFEKSRSKLFFELGYDPALKGTK